MFRVGGVIGKALYEVEVTGKASDPVVGSKGVRALVAEHVGKTVDVTPLGPAYVVKVDDPKSILALLYAKTKIRWVSDKAPSLIEG